RRAASMRVLESSDEPAKTGRHRGRHTADGVLALAIASGSTIADAARLAGVSETTAHRRRKSAAFKIQVEELRRGMVRRTLGILTDAATCAASTLREMLAAGHSPANEDEEPTPASVRVQAARALLEAGKNLRAEVELAERLTEIEIELGIG